MYDDQPALRQSAPHAPSFHWPCRIIDLAGLSVSKGTVPPPPFSILMVVTGGSGVIEIEGIEHVISGGTMLCCSCSLPLSLEAQFNLQGVWIEYAAVSSSGQAQRLLGNGWAARQQTQYQTNILDPLSPAFNAGPCGFSLQ
ncbi:MULTISPECIES: hypothetical protein [unclassified Paenibacillus]|uniref:hypothetical protein n=1 Tax=unclassified Paenibacillus TaxID=185978 RepID=UPI002406B9BD|nr:MULTISPECIES: hypothetical protein [unclassified Paenibacillus]